MNSICMSIFIGAKVGVNSASARRGFLGILLPYLCIYKFKTKIPGEGRKSGGVLAPPAPPSLAPMSILDGKSSPFC